MAIRSKPQFNPFPGLRPFGIEEDYLFFGREEQVSELLGLLREHRFLAVVGTSGSGKSSLVRAGLLPALHGGTLTGPGSSWEVLLLRPGGDPITNLASNLVEADLYDGEDEESLPRVKATLTRSRTGLVEAVKQSDLPPDTNLLVVVDQFEELFRYRDSGVSGQEGATAFVKLLLAAANQQEQPIYIAITMRSDYLGDCAQIPGLAEAVNDGEYLIPRLSRKQRRAAIEKPAHVGGGEIAAPLVHKLLNEVGDDADQLPILQHALMRIWDHWAADGNPDQPISLSHYQQVGGLSEALSQHADEVYAALPDDRHRLIARKLFQAITERGPDNRGIRRPTSFNRLCEIVCGEPEEVTLVIDAFRRAGRTFLMPPEGVELNPETVIDISHESLMRVWRQLREWVEQESQSARIYRRLADTAALHQEGKAGLYHDPDLQIASSWRETTNPSEAWAARYHPGFAQAIAFLDASREAGVAAERAREAARQREIETARRLADVERQRAEAVTRSARRLRGMVGGLAIVTMIAAVASLVALNAWRTADSLKDAALRSEESAKANAQYAESEARRATKSKLKAEEATRALQKKKYSSDMTLAQHAYYDGNIRALSDRLLEHVPDEGSPDPRGVEWFLWWNASHRESSIVDRTGGFIRSLAISPDGRFAAEGRYRFVIRLRDAENPQKTTDFELGSGSPRWVEFTPDSSLLLAVGANDLHFFSAEEAKLLGSVTAPKDTGLRGLSCSSKETVAVSGGDEGRLFFWDTTSWQRTEEYAGNTMPIHCVAYSPDGDHLAIGMDGTDKGESVVGEAQLNADSPLVLWNTTTQSAESTASGHTARITTVAWSADGEFLASGSSDESVRVWKKDLTPVKSLDTRSMVSQVAFSPDGRYLAAGTGRDNAIHVWSTDNWELVTTIMGHSKPVNGIAFHPHSGELWSASEDSLIKSWNIEDQLPDLDATLGDATLRTMLRGSNQFAVASDGRTLFCITSTASLKDDEDGMLIQRYDLESRNALSPWSGGDLFQLIEFSDDGSALTAVDAEGLLRVWRTDDEQLIAEIRLPAEDFDSLHAVTVSPDAAVVAWAAGSPDLLVSAIDTMTGDRLLEGVPSGMRNYPWRFMKISPDANQLGVKSGYGFRLLDRSGSTAGARQPDPRRVPHSRSLMTYVFSDDGTLGAGPSFDSLIYLHDTKSNQVLRTLTGHSSRVNCVAFSRDGRRLLSGSGDGTVRIWDVETGDSLTTLHAHRGGVDWVGFGKDEGQIISLSRWDGTVRVWDTMSREELARSETYWRELASYYEKADRTAQAIEAYDQAIRFSPDDADLLLSRAELNRQLTRKDTTAADYIKVIALGEADSTFVDQARALSMRTPLLAGSSEHPQTWRYSFDEPGVGWMEPGFDDSSWNTGQSPFGTDEDDSTSWGGPDIWLRVEFELTEPVTKPLFVNAHIDDVAEFYLNGVPAGGGQWVGQGSQEIFQRISCPAGAVAALKPGRNVFAVHCLDTGGGGAGIEAELCLDEVGQRWIEQLTSAIDKDPTNVHLLRVRAVAYREQGNSELAARDEAKILPILKQAVEADLNDPNAVWPESPGLLADALLAGLERGESVDPDARAVAEMPKGIANGWKRLAVAYYLTGDTQALDELLEHKPKAEVALGDLYGAAGDWKRAVATYSQWISPETIDADLLAKRGEAYAHLMQWENARSDWQRAAGLQPDILQKPFDQLRMDAQWQAAAIIGILLVEQNPGDRELWLQTVPAFVLAGDEQGYREFCESMLDQFADTKKQEDAEFTCKACALLPDAVDYSRLPLEVVSNAVDQGRVSDGLRAWYWGTRALVAYRRDKQDEAARCIQQAFDNNPVRPAQALCHAIDALVRIASGDPDGARKALESARKMVGEELPNARSDTLHNWTFASILIREAETRLEDEEN